MGTAVIDHQPQFSGRTRNSHDSNGPADNGQKLETDTEAAMSAPPSGSDQDHGPGLRERRLSQLVVLERIPTFLQPSLPWRDRLMHFTFAWYTVTMSTSGIALILAITPKRFRGLSIIGLIVFLFDLLFFLAISLAILARFILYRQTLRRAFTRPAEALFIPTLSLSVAAILSNVSAYGDIFLPESSAAGLAGFLHVAFWAYLGVTFLISVMQYHLLFSVKAERRLTVSAMTPAWILPIFPVMLAGTLAAPCAQGQPAGRAIAVLCAGLAAQGLGILVSIFFYATYLSRLMAYGLPAQRPGMFIAVGPPSFTCAALVAIADQMPRVFASLEAAEGGLSFLGFSGIGAGEADMLAAGIKLTALAAAIFLWGLSFWFFTSAVAAVVAGMPDRRFHLSWWSFVFPNVGFVLASIRIGTAVGSEGILWLCSVMTVLLVVAWAFIGFRCVRAVYRREIVWPGHDEDSS
ncbi:voltage-dependent anion channel-domain-containing protein [Lasiosphaeris hirsuta]|uniref:Voltage-dependent anion channel-domain-containing protein n=1 Tax=Lasiosphaeris hirsuta TaxID=260670 RepID=A0AA40AZQ0_9PEZI|nr:voltage-dependent anion channel-domain-containing protein [Lasiosphaeris hirsuta]